ncbi:hypothetical protein ATCC90586_005086 [Pythium insidiosum]|nr:hypothetical protein ATCC90586_005086 [Pythium insidiosum]
MQLRSQRRGKRELSAASAASAVLETAVASASSTAPKASVRRKKARLSGTSIPLDEPSESDEKILYRYPTLVPARLLRRYKRFLADVVLLDADEEINPSVTEEDGDGANVVTIYCPNTGPMVGLLDELPNARVQLSKSDDAKRKYQYTLEMIRIHNGERYTWVGVHSASANLMVQQALRCRWFPELGAYTHVQREVKFAKNSRVDFVLTTANADDGDHEKYVEVKSVTLAINDESSAGARCAVFPDTVSTRAQKHVQELMELLQSHAKKEGDRRQTKATQKVEPATDVIGRAPLRPRSGAIVFLVQRDDCDTFMPSLQHDPAFAKLCRQAQASGLQLVGYSCRLEPDEAKKTGVARLLSALPLHASQSQAPAQDA